MKRPYLRYSVSGDTDYIMNVISNHPLLFTLIQINEACLSKDHMCIRTTKNGMNSLQLALTEGSLLTHLTLGSQN